MIAAWRASFLFRVCLFFSARAPAWYAHSLLGRLSAFIARCWARSGAKRVWDGFLGQNPTAKPGIYEKFLLWAHRTARKAVLWLAPALERSLAGRTTRALGRFTRRLAAGSVLARLLHACGMSFRRGLILLFSLYLPLDWLLRDALSLGAAASLWDEVFFLLAFLYVLWGRAARRDWDGKSRATALDVPILLFIALGFFLMCVNAPIPRIALDGLRATVQYMLWFFVLARLLEDGGDVRVLCGGIAAVGLCMALHGIYQYIVAAPIPDSWTTDSEASVRTRAFSITGSPNILGAYLVMTAPLFAGFAYACRRAWAKLFCWGAVGVLCLCLLATFSKGAWVGMTCAVILFALLQDRRLFGLIGLGIPALMFVPGILDRIAFLFTEDFATASAVGGRALRWELGRQLLAEYPFLGFGLGRFGGAVAMQNQVLEVTGDFTYFYMDNYYLKIAVEMGYFGVICFVFLILALLLMGLRAWGRARRAETASPAGAARLTPLAAGIWAGLAGVAVHCLFENIFEEPYMMALYWGLAAALLLLPGLRRESAAPDVP